MVTVGEVAGRSVFLGHRNPPLQVEDVVSPLQASGVAGGV